MSSATTQVRKPLPPDVSNSTRDVFQRIAQLANRHRNAMALYRAALGILVDHYHSAFAAIHVNGTADSLEEHFATNTQPPKFLQRIAEAAMLESQSDGVALARWYEMDGQAHGFALLSVPLQDESQNSGAIALIANCTDRSEVERALFELKTLVTLICSCVPTIREPGADEVASSDAVQRALARAARFSTLTELAFAITNGLKTKYQCDQVILGRVTRRRVHILSISSMDALYPRSPGTRLIRQAMEECLDAGQLVCSMPGSQWSETSDGESYRLHLKWRSAIGDAAVASIPLNDGDRTVAVISLTRRGEARFRRDELEEIAGVVNAYAPALELMARATRGLPAQIRDRLFHAITWFAADKRWGRKLAAAMLVCFATWMVIGKVDYRLSTPCRITPTEVRHFAAPFEGVVAKALVEPGDQVKAGQLLYAMDIHDLDLQRQQLSAEAAVTSLELSHAVAQQQLDQAALARAQLQVIRARLAGVEHRVELAQVRAPTDGTIMAGEVKQRVGEVVPLGESLLEFAPHGVWTVDLRVDDKDVHLVRSGQIGHFITIARPDQSIACEVDRIEPAAEVLDGNNVFLVRAKASDSPNWILAGMDGVATLEVGRRPAWWVAFHRVIRFVRIHFWM